MKPAEIWTGMLMIAVLGPWLPGGPSSAGGRQPSTKCSAMEIGRALSLDETILTSHTRDTVGRSTEGGTYTVYRDQGVPRLLRYEDFGETGRASTSVYLMDSLTFAVWRVEHRYDGPIASGRSPRIERSTTSMSVVCDGVPLTGADAWLPDLVTAVRAEFRGTTSP